MKIFLVEDDDILNDIIVTTFQSMNYEVSSFNDGREALHNITNEYDLYLVDINLPNVNGLELLKKIKDMKEDANIFILSGDIDIKTILNAYQTGCNDFIKKPFDIREVVAKVQNSLKLEPVETLLRDGGVYNKQNKTIIFEDRVITIKLTKKESLLLDILIKYEGKCVLNEDIKKYVWSKKAKATYVRQLISKIKSKIPFTKLIENHPLNGYRILLRD